MSSLKMGTATLASENAGNITIESGIIESGVTGGAGLNTGMLQNGCHVYNSAEQSFTGGSYTIVCAFNTEVYDLAGEWDTTNYDFTATVAGKYLVILQVSFVDSQDTARIHARLYQNGTGDWVLKAFTRNNNGVTDHMSATCTYIATLAIGEKLQPRAYVNSTKNLTAGGTDSFLQIQRLM